MPAGELPPRRLARDARLACQRLVAAYQRAQRPRPRAVVLHHDGKRVMNVEEVQA